MIDTGIGKFIPKLVIMFVFALVGCGEGGGTATESEFPGDDIIIETIETDVIAPEAFSITDNGLWDGRPTFGGVWIAYPNIETPERVRITNAETDKTVIAALYRRERDFAGPQIEMSADAAAALGMVAGTPSELFIVALRRVEVEVESTRSAVPQPMTVPLRRPSSVSAPDIANTLVVETPGAVLIAPPAPEAPTPPDATTTPSVEETTLPPVEAAVELEAPVAPVSAPADPSQMFVQVATMESTRRANDLVTKLETAGLSAEIRESKSGDKTLYRIIAGPVTSPEGLEIMLSTVQQLGYKDAIPLR